jgi:DNA-binding NarL/FixJ family response regulator
LARQGDKEVPPIDGGETDALRVVIADDDPLARRAIRDVLQEAGFVVAAAASDGTEAMELTLHYRPDLLLLDIYMPNIDGLTVIRKLRHEAPGVKIVIFSATKDEEVGMSGLRHGAVGYLSKDMDLSRLPSILRAVASGEAAVTRSFSAKLIDELRKAPHAGLGIRPVHSDLTAREWEVLDLLAAGLNAEQIASELVVSVETVRSHEKSLRRKLEVHSRAELIAAVADLRAPAVRSPRDGGEL